MILRFRQNLMNTATQMILKGYRVPPKFSEYEIYGFYEQEQTWHELNTVVGHWRDQLVPVGEEGWISNEEYGEAVISKLFFIREDDEAEGLEELAL
ncbi:hypothetical protein N7540_010624 [Penicillium herquei]|nr:hypothetical protein N7540_010624 [Penicillium herquei]